VPDGAPAPIDVAEYRLRHRWDAAGNGLTYIIAEHCAGVEQALKPAFIYK